MKYDARDCYFNMDTGCVELLLRDGRKISIGLHRGRGCAGHYRFFELVMSGIFWCCPINFNGIFILLQFSLRLLYLFHANLYAHG